MSGAKPEATSMRPQGLSASVIVATMIFCFITIAIVSLRVWFRRWLLWTRIEPNAWGLDDLLAGFGLVAFAAACCFTIAGCYYGLGQPDSHLSAAQKVMAQKFIFCFQLSEAAFTVLVKASIAVFLLRLTTQRRYRFALWFVIIATVVGCVVPGVFVLVLCKPIAAQWDPSLGTCGDYGIITKLSYVVSVITVVTDWTCAIIPCVLVRRLNIPSNQKLPLMAILSLGILASLASIGRMPYLQSYNTTVDRLVGEANIVLWCIIEGALAFIAGSLPPLRKAPQLLLRSIDITSDSQNSQSDVIVGATRQTSDSYRGRIRTPLNDSNDSQNSLLVESKDISLRGLSNSRPNTACRSDRTL